MRLLIAEWHVSEDGPVEPGSTRSFVVVAFDGRERQWYAGLLGDAVELSTVSHYVADGYEDGRHAITGVVEEIYVIEAQCPLGGGSPVPGSGSVHRVDRAAGNVGDIDFAEPLPVAFVLDVRRLSA